MTHERFRAAAHRVLENDGTDAARLLEGVLHEDYADDERVEDLLEVLAFYNPAEGPPYTNHATLRREVQLTLKRLGDDSSAT